MMNTDHYVEVLRRTVIPEMRKCFPGCPGVFEQDLAPCHTSKNFKSFLRVVEPSL